MNSDKNIMDSFLQQKVEESSFPFNEAHWENALHRLNEEDDNKKPIFPWWKILGLLVLVTTSIFGIKYFTKNKNIPTIAKIENEHKLKNNNDSTKPENITTKNNSKELSNTKNNNTKQTEINTTIQAESNTPNLENNKTTKKEIVNANKLNTPKQFLVKNNTKTVRKTDKTNATIQSNSIDNINTTNKNEQVILNKVNKKYTTTNVSSSRKNEKKNDKNKVDKKGNNELLLLNSSKKDETLQENKNIATTPLGKQKTTNANSIQKINQTKTVAKNSKNIIQEIANAPNKNTIDNATVATKNAVPISKEIKVVKETTVEKRRMTEAEMIKYNPRYVTDLHAFVYKKTDTTFMQKIIVESPKEKEKAEPVNHTLQYFSSLQMAVNKTLVGNTNASQQWKPTPYIGFGAVLPLTAKLNLSSMLALTYFSGLNAQSTSYAISYGFGRDSTSSIIKETKQWQIQLPIAMQYVFGKQYVQAGVGVNFGFAVQDKITDNTGKNSTNFAYNNGIRALDYFLHIGYGIHINAKLALSILLQQGLSDISKNSFYNNTLTDRQVRCNAGIIYNFTKK